VPFYMLFYTLVTQFAESTSTDCKSNGITGGGGRENTAYISTVASYGPTENTPPLSLFTGRCLVNYVRVYYVTAKFLSESCFGVTDRIVLKWL
jgi:hypothetical protein